MKKEELKKFLIESISLKTGYLIEIYFPVSGSMNFETDDLSNYCGLAAKTIFDKFKIVGICQKIDEEAYYYEVKSIYSSERDLWSNESTLFNLKISK